MISIFTVALNSVEDLSAQWRILCRLRVPFRWSIVEGYAEPVGCTSWCQRLGSKWHNNGGSIDGTREFLLKIASDPRVTIRLADKPWSGKLEMVNSALEHLPDAGTLIEIDADEFWTAEQIELIYATLKRFPEAHGLQFFCRLWMTERHVIFTEGGYGSRPYEWNRAWRYDGRQRFISHEPPQLERSESLLPRAVTRALGLVFEHRSYVRRKQVELKQDYYGYAGAVEGWERLRQSSHPAVLVSDYLPWVQDNSMAVALRGADAQGNS